MPTYSLEQHDNDVFYIHWTEGRRSKRQSTRQTDSTQAQIFLGEWLTIKNEGRDKDGVTSYTIADLWGLYYERHVEKNNTTTRSADTVWNNLKVHFGDLTLPAVTQQDADGVDKVEEYILLRGEGEIGTCEAASGTIRNELTLLKSALNWCAKPKQKIITPAEVPVFDLPPGSPPRDRWLRTPEIQKLMASAVTLRVGDCLSRVERFIWLALETGARLMAILELTWSRVDLEIGVIDYRVPGRPETKKRRAVVPISSALRPVLERAYEERTTEYVCDGLGLGIWRTIKAVAKHAAVEDVSPHVFRHTAATQMLRRGVPVWQVAGVLANTVAQVEKTYGHHIPDGLAAAVEMISGPLAPPVRLFPAPIKETTE